MLKFCALVASVFLVIWILNDRFQFWNIFAGVTRVERQSIRSVVVERVIAKLPLVGGSFWKSIIVFNSPRNKNPLTPNIDVLSYGRDRDVKNIHISSCDAFNSSRMPMAFYRCSKTFTPRRQFVT